MKMDKETQEKIQELQSLEQTLHPLMMQKQAFQMELNETENALSEINRSKDEVFKIIGQIMVKTSKEKVKEDLDKKQKIISLRLETIDKQESNLTEKATILREEVMKNIK